MFPTIKAIDAVSKNAIGLETWRNSFVDTFLPLVLGVLYVSAGVGHFVAASDFRDIYPPYGTWGIWYLPGSAQFHVTWTGIFEFLGGGGLLWTSVMRRNTEDNDDDDDDDDENNNWSFQLVQPISAAVLFVLTILVTPANIYMYTHGATMGGAEALDLSFHYFRFGMQILLLSLLFVLAKDSFFFAWGDELD